MRVQDLRLIVECLQRGARATWNNLQDSIAFGEEIQNEDIELCEDVWRNLQTGGYHTERDCVKRENGVHHFHGLLNEFLARE